MERLWAQRLFVKMSKRDRCMICARHACCERCVDCYAPVCSKCAVHVQRRYGAVDISCHLCAEYESVSRAHEIGCCCRRRKVESIETVPR
eukprot:3678249-Amphidinium_carterae.1